MNRNQKPLTNIFILLILPIFAIAQNSNEPISYPDIYLLENVQLVASPESNPRLTSVYINKGIIKGIGNSIKTPYNTQVIDMDSMYLYAGFIDPLSHTGIAAAEENDKKEKVKNPGNPSYEQAGITPNIQAKDLVTGKEKSIELMRKNGFTISHTVPRGGMITGQSAIILNKKANIEDLILTNNQALYAQFKSASGAYPSTLIGVISRFNELMRQSKDARSYEQKTMTKSVGMERASYPEELRALYPVVKKEMPVFFKAKESKNIHRALKLAKNNNINMVLSEMKNGWNHIDNIKSNGYEVLLSLDLPKIEEEKPKDSIKVADKVDPTVEALKAKQKVIKEKYHNQAALFEQSGIPFSFAYLEVKPKDIHKNLKATIKAGLSEKAALASLTTNPAKILGISSYAGTVETGKIANLVLTDKPLFQEKTKIKYVFVEGLKYDYSETKAPTTIEKTELDKLVGSWSYKMDIPIPQNSGTIKIENQDGKLVLNISLDAEPNETEEITDAVYKDGNLSFSFESDTEMGSMNISYNLDINGDIMEGTVSPGSFGTFDVNGKKSSKPE